MQRATFAYTADAWSQALPVELDSDRTLVLVFGASSFIDRPEPILELVRAFSRSHLIGCSTAGEILDATVYDDSLAVAVVRFDSTRVQTATATAESVSDSFAAGESLARQLIDDQLRGVLVLSDGLHVNGSELVRGLNSVLPRSVVITGGLAGDGDRFSRTWVTRQGTPRPGLVAAAGLYGDRIRVGHGSKGGWDIFGPERRVTRSEGNVLYELDGKQALALYKKYLGHRASGLPATALLFPLALRSDQEAEKQIVRTVLAVDEDEQTMTFAGDIPEGYLAQLMKANFDRLIDGAAEAALMTRERGPTDTGVLAVAISCVGRRLVLGERTEEELETTLEVLPAGTRQVGFYSYGEISPFAAGSCDLHNQTMTLTTVAEV